MPALITCWAVLRAPAGGLLASMLRHGKELDITDAQADLLMAMSPATIDRKLASTQEDAAQKTVPHEIWVITEVPDSSPNLGRVGRRCRELVEIDLVDRD